MKTYLARVSMAACRLENGRYAEGPRFVKRMVSDNKDNLAIANDVAKQYPGHTIKAIQWN